MAIGSKAHGGCGDERLRVLLEQNEDSAEFRAAAHHVEQCPGCQQRLEELAAEGAVGGKLRSMLAQCGRSLSTDVPPPTFSDQEDSPFDRDNPDLEFLAPGSHPEMLGRLGRYEVEKVIGSGGMGVVLKAFDTELNRSVAIKVLASHLVRNGTARQRFAREGRAAAAIMHENVVAIHNVESEGQTPYLVMRYVDGQSLQARVERGGPLNFKELLRIGMQAASGLAAAHAQGVVHRDVKPSNILLEGDLERVFLTDFGLARAVDDVALTGTGLVAGTPSYMSPEQARGELLDVRSDLFSLGASLYFAATGRPPFRAESWVGVVHRLCHDRQAPACKVNPEIPVEVSRTIDRLLQKKPHRRFKSAEALREHLADLLARSQAPARLFPRRNWRTLFRPARRFRSAAVLCGIAILLGALWFRGNCEKGGEGVGRRQTPISSNARRRPLQGAVRIEREVPIPTSAYTESFDAVWQQEINSLRETVARLESQWGQVTSPNQSARQGPEEKAR
jgi:serine/threonine protein kinase